MTEVEFDQAFESEELEYQRDQCERFAAFLENDLRAFDRLHARAQAWKANVQSGRIRFDFEFDRKITGRYRKWLENSERRLRQISLQKETGCWPEIITVFEQRVEEAREIVTQRGRSEAVASARYKMLHGGQ